MIQTKRVATLLGIAAFVLTLFYITRIRDNTPSPSSSSWRTTLPQAIGLGELVDEDPNDGSSGSGSSSSSDGRPSSKLSHHDPPGMASPFKPGHARPAGYNYTRNLVVAKTKKEEADWLDAADLGVTNLMVYVVDDKKHSEHKVPKNKGHEVMVYLTYIIDHYDELPDVSMFMHSHQFAWHQNDLLNNDGSEMVKRLSSERVMRSGFMNMRCHWKPGCPDWMHPGTVEADKEKKEETLMAGAWAELFPNQPVPEVLGGACCAQFALSRERILSIERETYVYYRDWMLRTRLEDKWSGRVWEYMWHYVFSGEAVVCPNQWQCYCDGYGVCFEDEKAYDYWFELKFKWTNLKWELELWHRKAEKLESYRYNGVLVGIEGSHVVIPEPGRNVELVTQIQALEVVMEDARQKALKRGTDPQVRARIAGRPWQEGDGY